eukprot:GHVU01207113.1.p1 GENE.GHVU01207113.1~~GHVU01207113.1.p1  ORF type:complete len:148 (-),score=10.14 GHVU01207113.1:692-1135(-)
MNCCVRPFIRSVLNRGIGGDPAAVTGGGDPRSIKEIPASVERCCSMREAWAPAVDSGPSRAFDLDSIRNVMPSGSAISLGDPAGLGPGRPYGDCMLCRWMGTTLFYGVSASSFRSIFTDAAKGGGNRGFHAATSLAFFVLGTYRAIS